MSRLDEVAKINRECFTSDDPYSDLVYLKCALWSDNFNIVTTSIDKKVVGYIIYHDCGSHIESIRRAVTKEARGEGIGIKLSKRLTSIARKANKEIFTYVAKSNLPSLNSNLKVGYRIVEIGADWVYLRYKV